jgi:hypothetical protein
MIVFVARKWIKKTNNSDTMVHNLFFVYDNRKKIQNKQSTGVLFNSSEFIFFWIFYGKTNIFCMYVLLYRFNVNVTTNLLIC